MKKLLIVITVVISAYLIACSTPTKYEVITKQPWVVKADAIHFHPGDVFNFNKDGSFSWVTRSGGEEKGTWNFQSNETQILITIHITFANAPYREDKIVFEIIQFSPKEINIKADAATNQKSESLLLALVPK